MMLVALGCQGGSNSGGDSGGGSDLASSTDLIGKADSDGSMVNIGCPSFSPCGGAISPGTYAITAFCGSADPVPYSPVCQTAPLTTTSVEASGTYVFSADGTYSNSVTVTPHGILTVPASCMTQPGSTVQTCTDLERALLEHIASGSTTATIICSGTTDCARTIVMTETVALGQTYSIQGDTLTLFSPSNSSQATDPYCVSGNHITVGLG
jgi:hypothetical protein